ncbi:hypothetical protein SAMN05428982_2750 [Pseudoxanthomonas sp. CF385]|nr:hypothetical protein SAMN05428982_2750 [Pseudoxanthomonas sp. CF385]
MGRTTDRLRKHHPSRGHETVFDRSDFTRLLETHLGSTLTSVRPEDITRLMFAIGIAASEESRITAGHESRKDSLAALRAMFRLPDDDLIAVLPTCDMATFGRIQTAQTELDYRRNGIPIVEVPSSTLTDADEVDARLIHRRSIELPTTGRQLYLPMGIDGLREAVAEAIAVAEQETGSAGNKSKPHMEDLAEACNDFMRKYPLPRRKHDAPSRDVPLSAPVRFATEIYALAGMNGIGDSRVEQLLTRARRRTEKGNCKPA